MKRLVSEDISLLNESIKLHLIERFFWLKITDEILKDIGIYTWV